MKYIIFFAVVAAALDVAWSNQTVVPYRAPDVSACYAIADPDARTMCRAEVKRDPSICYAIANPDTRALCRARAAR